MMSALTLLDCLNILVFSAATVLVTFNRAINPNICIKKGFLEMKIMQSTIETVSSPRTIRLTRGYKLVIMQTSE